VQAVAIQSDGKIVAAGSSFNGANNDVALVRYHTDGSLDTTFNTTGTVTTAIGSSYDEANAVAIQSDGKIVAAGFSSNGVDDDFALVRYHTDGSLDTTFNTTGTVTTPIGSSYDEAIAVVIQSDGKIVAARPTIGVTTHDRGHVLYLPSRTLRSRFAICEKVTGLFW
jgi:uncharacterized delta-60 repeat protein